MSIAGLKPFVAASSRGVSQYATVEQIEEVMGLPAESLSPIAWLVIQEEAKDVKREQVAKNLGVTVDDIDRLVDASTGCTGPDSAEIWAKGIVGLRAVAIVNSQNISSGWDAIEAIAVDKIARNLHAMKGPGDIDRMMQLATIANKAIRRANGEGSGRGSPASGVGNAQGGMTVELSSGHLGTIRLNLSPVIQEQLSRPTRIIDQVRNKTPVTSQNLEMLNLKDTRKLADDEEAGVSTLDVQQSEVTYKGMTFSMDVEGPKSE